MNANYALLGCWATLFCFGIAVLALPIVLAAADGSAVWLVTHIWPAPIGACALWAYTFDRSDAEQTAKARDALRLKEIRFAKSGLAEIDLMPGIEFDNFVLSHLRRTGWHVTTTAVTGDFGELI